MKPIHYIKREKVRNTITDLLTHSIKLTSTDMKSVRLTRYFMYLNMLG